MVLAQHLCTGSRAGRRLALELKEATVPGAFTASEPCLLPLL